MKQTRLLICYFAFLSFACSPHFAWCEDGDITSGEAGESIQKFVDVIHERLGFSGVVLAGRDGKIVAAIARGDSDPKSEKPLRRTSLFEIASCTKSFTAITILRLVESGKLSLDDSIAKHLPDIPENCQAITIRHLLTHTSGIPGNNTRGSGDDVKKVIPTFLAGGPRFPPGRRHEYWNQGYSLLSEIIARSTGQSYQDALRSMVFEPCEMTSSRFTGDPAPTGIDVSVGVSNYGPPRTALEHPYGSYGFQYRGMGGLVTNAEDLWKWDRALAGGKLLNDQSIREMIQAGPGNYGLGWRVGEAPDGTNCHFHGGSVRGFVAKIHRFPSIDGATFVLSNRDDTIPLTIIQHGVEQILFGKPADIVVPAAPDPKFVARVSGEYIDNKTRKLVIASGSGLPTVRIFWGGPITYGMLGLAADGTPHLFLLKSGSGGNIEFNDDGPLEFSPKAGRGTSVSLAGLTPPLVFER